MNLPAYMCVDELPKLSALGLVFSGDNRSRAVLLRVCQPASYQKSDDPALSKRAKYNSYQPHFQCLCIAQSPSSWDDVRESMEGVVLRSGSSAPAFGRKPAKYGRHGPVIVIVGIAEGEVAEQIVLSLFQFDTFGLCLCDRLVSPTPVVDAEGGCLLHVPDFPTTLQYKPLVLVTEAGVCSIEHAGCQIRRLDRLERLHLVVVYHICSCEKHCGLAPRICTVHRRLILELRDVLFIGLHDDCHDSIS
jgi:hypothetical protein